jgi:hypothetical protein
MIQVIHRYEFPICFNLAAPTWVIIVTNCNYALSSFDYTTRHHRFGYCLGLSLYVTSFHCLTQKDYATRHHLLRRGPGGGLLKHSAMFQPPSTMFGKHIRMLNKHIRVFNCHIPMFDYHVRMFNKHVLIFNLQVPMFDY